MEKTNMVDLKAKPFYLDEEQIRWVDDTYNTMSTDEKIGQLFILLNFNRNPEHIREVCEKYHIGGLRWQMADAEEAWEQNRLFQEYSKIPLIIAANCETGGNGAVPDGTYVATAAACGADTTLDAAYRLGRVSGIEAEAIGCNMTFSPVTDIYMNWRNTIVNTRAFSGDPDTVIREARAYRRGVSESRVACTMKHFPGDGSEERDQHLLMGCNDLTKEEWDRTYGRVYQALIDDGIEAVMVGHIAQRAYSKYFRPDLTDSEIMPASLSPELLQNLLRKQLGFNGLIITDASHMAGLTCACDRYHQVAGAIAAGCDMFLFFNDPDEDFGYMKRGLEEGLISEERLSDAVRRILAFKAHMGLDRFTFPGKEGLKVIGCREHRKEAALCADETVTLVKDTQNLIPIPPEKRRAKVYFLESVPESIYKGTDRTKEIVREELERAGFDCDFNEDFYEMERKSPSSPNSFLIRQRGRYEDLKKRYDVVLVFSNMKGYAQSNSVRITFSSGHSNEIPWYTADVPAAFISLSYTNHLIDVPMFRTFINAYCPTREYIRAAVEKLIGVSEFKGRAEETVWCGRWDTKR